ncbi:uncharacterized protein MEPE_03070 [Melanopsichium pennsylvanicum]|uniref:Uncharacterized protein n=2 Tax=Melanopsichium pennsylvanicum TaxID=63383 RepID=A0AAJ5C547_9BASI|nr:putative protein [Melanopsichium pennsylvanicum 4]SNX84361.1 uncharacterized protein MEPE_03070 [Melanopsichium pennsylvanicum]
MVKVKLRVPLSSAPRDTSSPLANPLRSAPDYSDDEAGPPLREGTIPDVSNGFDDQELDDDDDQDQEADELDELDELDDEGDDTKASSSTPKRRSITLKPRSSKSGASSSASPSIDGSASPHPGANTVKRASSVRMAKAQAMSVEELDALPAAKRRKTAKARGAAGPGRGWRKGLTKGQKPVYELPPAETTPVTFGNTANARFTPPITAASVTIERTPTPSSSALPKSKSSSILATTAAGGAAASGGESRKSSLPPAPSRSIPGTSSSSAAPIKIVSGPGGHTFTGDLSAKAGTAKNPGFRYPPLPSSRAGPPVHALAKIPTSFQTGIALDRTARQPRRWTKGKREILSMGGRPWSITVFYGGEDRDYEKKVDAPVAVGAGANVNSVVGVVGSAGIGDKVASKAGTPSNAAQPAGGLAKIASASKAVSPIPVSTPTPTDTGAAAAAQGGSTPKVAPSAGTGGSGGGGSPLPPPKHLGGLANETNWRGQSPAFLFGGR